MYGKLYRHVLLPIFDRMIKGRKTIQYWKQAEERQWWSRSALETFQFEALNKLITHAWNTSPYYRQTWEPLGITPKALETTNSITQWPIIDRTTIRDNRMQMRSTSKHHLVSKGTGGSSGEPLRFDLDMESHERRTALMYRGYEWAGGGPGSRQMLIWGSHVGPVSTKQRWKQSLHQRFDYQRLISCFEFTPDKMQAHFSAFNQYRPEVVVAYTTAVYEFARYLEANDLTPYSPKSIIVGAEKLHDFQRTTIEKVFRAPVFETYGSREVMLIGAECEHHNGLHLSIDNLLVEVVNDDGNPTPDGEEGNVVITDLFNYGMPFIRYMNGDRAIAGFETCQCGRGLPLLKQVVGRQLDAIKTNDGRIIPGEFFPHLIKDYESIRRFQVVQQSLNEITVKLVVTETFDDNTLALISQQIEKQIGDATHVNVEVVEDIPLTRVGKHRVVVSTA